MIYNYDWYSLLARLIYDQEINIIIYYLSACIYRMKNQILTLYGLSLIPISLWQNSTSVLYWVL